MKKIKVYLQSPLGFSDSLYYKNLLKFPPENVEYSTNISSANIITNKSFFKTFNLLKKIIRDGISLTNYPLLMIFKNKSENRNIDLIHCAHSITSVKKVPWVADFEALWQFWISGKNTLLGKKMFLKGVLRENCRKLLAWTEEAKKEMIVKFPELNTKIEVISYAMPFIPQKNKMRKEKTITLLFLSRYFYKKGGLHALEAIDISTKEFKNVKAIIAGDLPKEIYKKYSKNKKIKFYNFLQQKELFEEIYPESDIFVYPGYSDTFGFGFIEAMNFGLPVITVDGYARKEIVTEGKTGFVIERPVNLNFYKTNEEILNKIVEKIKLLVEDKKCLKRMSKNCIEEIKNGKFSIKERNKKLEKIYSEAIK